MIKININDDLAWDKWKSIVTKHDLPIAKARFMTKYCEFYTINNSMWTGGQPTSTLPTQIEVLALLDFNEYRIYDGVADMHIIKIPITEEEYNTVMDGGNIDDIEQRVIDAMVEYINSIEGDIIDIQDLAVSITILKDEYLLKVRSRFKVI